LLPWLFMSVSQDHKLVVVVTADDAGYSAVRDEGIVR
jgi:hypothetical protein